MTTPQDEEMEREQETLRKICKKILPNGLPDNYTVFDVETNGLLVNVHCILQVGWALVEDRTLVHCGGALLDWTRIPEIDQDWLRHTIDSTNYQMTNKGEPYGFTYERIAEEGLDPLEVLADYLEIFRGTRARNAMFVAHNGYRFDAPMTSRHFQKWLGEAFQIGDNEMVDSGALEKAKQIGRLPQAGDSLSTYTMDVMRAAPRVQWNLNNHCVRKYNLLEKHGVSTTKAHDAGYDCRITHYLIEAFRAELEEQPVVLPSIDAA